MLIKGHYAVALEWMQFKVLNNDMVGFTNTTTRDMLDHIFLSYDSITAVDLDHNWENMRKAWEPQQPVESLFKRIQDCVDCAEAGGITISEAQKLHSVYSKIFAT
jgi:hypothetical protein